MLTMQLVSIICLIINVYCLSALNKLLSSNHALQLITQNEDGYLRIEKDVAKLVSQITESIGIVSIIGPYRTGKSYLLNQLISNGPMRSPFAIGSTVQPHSKGISIFPYKNNKETLQSNGDKFPQIILFMDTVGLFAPETTEQSDARIVALSSLISTILIFNHMNVVDSQEIDRFNFIAQYSRAVPNKHGTDIKWKHFQPELLWVIRDFYLELKNKNGENINANKWLLDSLTQINNGLKLYDLFQSINVFTLPRPVNSDDNDKLLHLTQNPHARSNLFKTQLNKIRNYIFSNIKYKTLNGIQPINGKMLMDLIETCVRRLNSDKGLNSISTIKSLIQSINQQLIINAFEEYKNSFQKKLKNKSSGKNTNSCMDADNDDINDFYNELGLECEILQYLPLKEETLSSIHTLVFQNSLHKLHKELHSTDSLSETEINENVAMLSSKTKNWYKLLLSKNKMLIISVIDKKYQQLINLYQKLWNESSNINHPQNELVLQSLHVKKLKESVSKYKMFILKYSENNVDWIDRKIDELKNKLNSIFHAKLQYNYDISHSQCNGSLSLIRLQYNGQCIVQHYPTLHLLEKQLMQTEQKFNQSCRGPALKDKYYELYQNFSIDCNITLYHSITETKIQYGYYFLYFCIGFIISLFINPKISVCIFVFWCAGIVFHPIVSQLGIGGHMYCFREFLYYMFETLGTIISYVISAVVTILGGAWMCCERMAQAYEFYDNHRDNLNSPRKSTVKKRNDTTQSDSD